MKVEASSLRDGHSFWYGAVDPIRVLCFEKFLVLSFLYYMVERFRYAREWLTDYGFHLTTTTRNSYHVDPFPLLPEAWLPFVAVIVFGAGIALLCDWQRPIMRWVLLVWAIYIPHVDSVSSYTLNKLYIVCFALFALMPAPKSVTLPAGETAPRQSAWPLRTLQATLLIQYFTAGTCKVFHGDWLKHSDVLWTQVQGLYCTDIAAWMLRDLPQEAWAVQMYLALAFELLAPVLFMLRRTRLVAMVWGIGFHVLIAATMHQLIYFSLQMIIFYILFLPDDWLHAGSQWARRVICRQQDTQPMVRHSLKEPS